MSKEENEESTILNGPTRRSLNIAGIALVSLASAVLGAKSYINTKLAEADAKTDHSDIVTDSAVGSAAFAYVVKDGISKNFGVAVIPVQSETECLDAAKDGAAMANKPAESSATALCLNSNGDIVSVLGCKFYPEWLRVTADMPAMLCQRIEPANNLRDTRLFNVPDNH